jgi:5-methylcytosine-specific restriction endonuclease McrA
MPFQSPQRKPIPPAVRTAVLKRAAGQCEDCGAVTALELHHRTYSDPRYSQFWPDAPEIFGNETPDELDALCRDCHRGRHVFMGEFYADPEERDAEADYFDHMFNKGD